MVTTLARIDDVNCLVATLESVLDERQQHAIPLVGAVEEGAHMTGFAQLGASDKNRCGGCPHDLLLIQGCLSCRPCAICRPPRDPSPAVSSSAARNGRCSRRDYVPDSPGARVRLPRSRS